MMSYVRACSVMSDSAISWTVAYQAPQSMGFPRQEYWSGLLFPSPGDLPNPGIETRDFSGISAGKESICNPGDQGSGRSFGEGIGYSYQYSWASLIIQTVKNLPALRET